MKGPALLLLCAVTLTHSVDPKTGRNEECNCDPSEAWQICDANFGKDNVLIAHEYCDRFYSCANGRPVAQSCPAGLLYNPYTEACDWAANVDCGDRPISDGQDIDDEDCDEEDAADNGGVDSDNDQEDNNGDNGSGDNDKGDGDIGGGDTGGSDNGGSDNGGSDNGSGDNGGSDNGSVGGGNCDPSEAPSICAADDSENVLVAHENCNQFYICAGGEPIALKCPNNLLFNPNTDQCDWPENVDCGDRVIPDPEENNNDGSDNGGSDNGGSDNGGSDNGSAENGGSDNGGSDNGGSDNGGSDNGGSDNGGSDNGGSDNGGSDNGGAGTCNCNPGEAPEICGVEGSDGVLVANENCNQFYICANGKPVVFTCPGNLLYNPYTEQCDWPENVECGDRVIPEPEDDNNSSDNGGSDNAGSDNGGSDNGGSENGGSDNGGSENGGSDNGGSDNNNVGGGNCDPSEAPSICADEESDGVLVAHENCNKYYVCSGGNPVAMPCPGGLLFNPVNDQCDWPDNVDCGDRVIPDPEDNDNGSSDNGASDNGGSDNGGSDNGGSDNGASDNGVSDNGGSDNGGGGTCNCNPGEAPEICAAEGSDGVLVANENCNQFYICANGKPVVFTCPANLLYNPYTEQCDWAENVECGDRVIPDPEDNDNGGSDNGASDNGGSDNGGSDNGGSDNGASDNGVSDNGGSDNGGGGTCNCNPGEAPEICAAEGSDGVLVANENCNQFYICANGKPVVFTCPANLLYNPYTEQCDWAENVECGDRVIPDPEDNDNGGSDNGASDNGGSDNGGSDNGDSDNGASDNGASDNGGSDNGGGGTCNCNPGEAPEICAAEGSDGVLVANENCNQFYICANGKPVVFTCPANLLYNPYTEQCDWAENVECGDRVIPDPEDNDNGGSDNGASDNGGSDNGGSDNGGSDNGASDNGASDNGGSDNGGGGTCNCNPGEAPEICAAEGSDGVLVANENCNQFYICANGKPVVFTCPANLLYNPYTEQCDWAENVECGDRVIPDPEDNNNGGSDNGGSDNGGSDNGGSDNGGSDNGGSDNGASDNGGSGTCNCNPGEAPEICAAEGSDGVLIAHENCNQFYICSNGLAVALTCPSNLLYNPYTEQCDWADNVECGDRVIPDPEDNDNSGSDNGGSDNGGSDNGGSDNGGNDNGGSDNGGSDNGGTDNGGSGTCNCNPGEAPEICAAEGSDGVLIAHENCNQFYICSYGKPVALTCPSNLLYNPYTEKCDWAENVECGDRVIPDPEDNDNSGSDNGGSDNGGSDNGGSDNGGSDNGGSDNGGSDNGGSDNGGSDNGGSDNGGSDNGGSDNGVSDNDGNDTGTCNCNPGEAPEICAAEGSDGVLVAHENCNQFYNCFNGNPVVLTCPANLLYNPFTEQCDWPENVDCGDRVIPDPEDNDTGNDNGGNDNGGSDNDGSDNDGSDNEGSDNGGSDNNDNGSDNDSGDDNNNVYDDPSQAPNICADGGSSGVFVAHENCDQYYMCTSGLPVAFTCPGDLLFNPLIQQCDWPRDVDCGDRVAPDVQGCYCNPRRAPALCAGENSEGLVIAHESCNQYYVCAGGIPVARSCPGALFYNPHHEVCDWPMNVDCDSTYRVSPFTSLNKHLESRQTVRM